jgi:16S rRNA (cytosine1402-N4)-methyltransferase
MLNDPYHIPVLLNVATSALITDPEGLYVDVTFGGGGHSREILKNLTSGKLIAFDQDNDALENTIDDDRFTLVRQNFRNIENVLDVSSSKNISGVLADLGVSSYQFDHPERGFSFRFNNRLDMRMNSDSDFDAYQLINNYDEQQLQKVFSLFGDFRLSESRRLSSAIVNARLINSLETTFQLASLVEPLVPVKIRNQFLARVFQSIRIEVNQELSALSEFLDQLPKVLQKNGVVCIITYHSLEDRLVKNFFKSGNCDGVLEKDFYGNFTKPFTQLHRKPVTPDEAEIKLNPRARSAKLRIAVKN